MTYRMNNLIKVLKILNTPLFLLKILFKKTLHFQICLIIILFPFSSFSRDEEGQGQMVAAFKDFFTSRTGVLEGNCDAGDSPQKQQSDVACNFQCMDVINSYPDLENTVSKANSLIEEKKQLGQNLKKERENINKLRESKTVTEAQEQAYAELDADYGRLGGEILGITSGIKGLEGIFGSEESVKQSFFNGDVHTDVKNVIKFGTYNACSCCENPNKCLFGNIGGPAAFIGLLNQASGVATATAFAGGISGICKDVSRVQTALAGINGIAGTMCLSKGSRCMSKHNNCIEKINRCISQLEHLKVIQGLAFTTGIPAQVTQKITDLQGYQRELEVNKPKCDFANRAGGNMIDIAGSLGLEAFSNHVCAKNTGSGEPKIEDCNNKNNAEYDSLSCQCKREDEGVDKEACCADGKNTDLAICNPCIRDPGSLECQCRNPIMAEHLEGCQERDFRPDGPPDIDGTEVDEETDSSDFSFSGDDGSGTQDVFGKPNVFPFKKDTPKGGNAGAPMYSKAAGGGPGGGPGGVGGASGGGPGEEAPAGEPKAKKDASDAYSNLLQGLTGKEGGSGGFYGGGYNSNKGSSSDKPFDLSKFLPKKGGTSRGVASDAKSASAKNESIFEVSSRVTRKYCQKNQVECIPQQSKQ